MATLNFPKLQLSCKGSPEQLNQLQALYDSGELSAILGVSIQDLRRISLTTSQPSPSHPASTLEHQKPDWIPRLSNWIQATYENFEWDLTTSLLMNPKPLMPMRSAALERELQSWQVDLTLGEQTPDHISAAIARTKTLMLGDCAFQVFVGVRNRKDDSEQRDILIQVRSLEVELLPQGLQLVVLDETGHKIATDNPAQPYLEVISDSQSCLLQLDFYGLLDEFFSISLRFNDYEQIEQFLI
jgi:Protein of unknown function (DUF1822)